MLLSLSIKNYALIEQLDIHFHNGLSTITGETGAGKSILLGALALILGQRADVGILKDKSKKCIIEGTFDITDYHLQDFFAENCQEVDYQEHTIISRHISPKGTSRAFVNDSPVNLNLLKELGTRLVDIHSQHTNLALSNNLFQINVVDIFAKHEDSLAQYKSSYLHYKKLQREYKAFVEQVEKAKSDLDYYQHRYEQLEAANLKEGEQELLEEEQNTLSHAEEIRNCLQRSLHLLSESDENILFSLKDCLNSIQQITDFFPKADEIYARFTSVYIELKDLASETELLSNHIEYEPQRLEIINQRLDAIYSLQQKHRVSTVAELIALQDELKQQIEEIALFDFKNEQLQKQLSQFKTQSENLANQISDNRLKVLPVLEASITELLKQLGMPNTIFKLQHSFNQELTAVGKDNINFMFSANKNAELQEISKVASGGEISRVMLSIKSLISKSKSLPTIIFDEIDTGVSGDIADKMGNIIALMANDMQVINITHLPQIASKGKNHYLVYKIHGDHSTTTNMKLLSFEERTTEIAKMLSGENVTQAALNNAKELLKNVVPS